MSGFINGARDQYAEQQKARPGLGFYAAYGFGKLIRFFFLFIWNIRLTLLWVLLVSLAAAASPVFFWLVIAALVGLSGWSYWNRKILKFLPFTSDFIRFQKLRKLKTERTDGQRFLFQSGIMNEQQIEEVNPAISLRSVDDGSILTLAKPLTGLPPTDFAALADKYCSLLNAVRSSADIHPDGFTEIHFFTKDPLDAAQTRKTPAAIEVNEMKVPCAVDEYGAEVALTFGDSSGMVVGGVPGSGKTAGVTSFLLPLALSPYVDLNIIDGKGGSDWESYGSRAATYIRGDEDLTDILAFLEKFHTGMLDRIAHQKERLGNSNFWNVSADARKSGNEKFELLVIDECQGVFETTGRTKDEKEQVARITRICSSLVKRGRSAGYFAIFITQKPTSDSLPTAIRDNSGLRIAFRLTTAAAETAVLGVAPDDSLASSRAVAIPSSRKGGAVLASDSGEFRSVRFFYIPEGVQDELLKEKKVVSNDEK